jgi:putative membrane protein
MTDWERLDARMLLIGPTRVVRQFAIPFIVALVGIRTSDGGFGTVLLPFLVLGALVLGALPWLTTYFRRTDTQLQVRRGLLRRTIVTAPLDRVRSVDLESPLLHRMLGLTTVTIGTGVDDTRIVLDSLARTRADRLRVELLQRAPVVVPGPLPDTDPEATAQTDPFADPLAAPRPSAPTAEELARIDWSWLRFAPFSLSRLVVVAAAFGALSQVFDNLPLDRADDAWQWLGSQALPVLLTGVAVACLVGWVVISVGGYVLRWWDLRLVREGGNLRLTAGLFTTRSTSVEEARVRGVLLTEPVLLRAVGGAELSTLATGVGSGGVTKVLPPCPLPVATRVGTAVLEDARPLALPLLPHGNAARRRCHWRAQRPTLALLVATPIAWIAGAPGAVVALGLVVVALLAVAGVATGVASYRHLGHALAPGHLVSGARSLQRSRTVLERDGIIGWVVRQSWFQRRVGLATLVATTAAGPESVVVVDLPLAQAVALADAATPGMLSEVLATGH